MNAVDVLQQRLEREQAHVDSARKNIVDMERELSEARERLNESLSLVASIEDMLHQWMAAHQIGTEDNG